MFPTISCAIAIGVLGSVSNPGGPISPEAAIPSRGIRVVELLTGRPAEDRSSRRFWRSTTGRRVEWTFTEDDSDDARLERFLESRGLDRLLIAHLEIRLDRESNAERRRELAGRLAERYRQALLRSSADDLDEHWVKRAESLLRLNPDWDLVGLELAVLQAKFVQVEQDFRTWWFAGARASDRAALVDALREIARRLDEIHRRSLVAFQDGQGGFAVNEEDAERLNQELLKIERRVVHSQYLLGWTWLFLGLAQNRKADALHRAETYFREFLEVPEDRAVGQVDANWFDLRTKWHVRAWVGLAWTEQSLGNQTASDHLFELLSAAPLADVEVKVPLWQLESRVFAGQWALLADWIEQLNRTNWSRSQRVRFALAVIESAGAVAGATEIADRMIQWAALGLLRDFQASHLERLIDEGRLTIRGNPFLENWLKGYLAYVRAESDRTSFESAFVLLTRAFQGNGSEIDPADRARCEYLIGLIEFRRSQVKLAAEHFLRVAEALRDEEPSLAEEAAWMRTRSLASLARSDPYELGRALAEIDRWQQQFPEGEHFEKLEWMRTRLTCQLLTPAQAIQHLQRLKATSDSPDGWIMELAFQYYRQWKVAFQREAEDEAQRFEQLVQLDRQIQTDGRRSISDRVRSALWVVDARLLKGEPIESIAGRVDELANAVGANSQLDRILEGQIRGVQLQLAERGGDFDRAWHLAQELVRDFRGTPYERPALIYIAERFREKESLETDEIELAIQCNERLIKLIGDDEETVRRSANVRVAMSELVRLYRKKGKQELAEPIARFLVEQFPDQTRYVLAWARVLADQGRWAEGVPLWRQLAQSSPAGSEQWYESKWQLIRGLARTDSARAAQVLKQTRLLSPDMPAPWAQRFEELARQLQALPDQVDQSVE